MLRINFLRPPRIFLSVASDRQSPKKTPNNEHTDAIRTTGLRISSAAFITFAVRPDQYPRSILAMRS